MHTAVVLICVLGMGWGSVHEHPKPAPVVVVMPIWLVADTADIAQLTTMATDSLIVAVVCPAGKYGIFCACPGHSDEYPTRKVRFISIPTTEGVADTVFLVTFPSSDSLLVVVDGDSSLFTGFSDFKQRGE